MPGEQPKSVFPGRERKPTPERTVSIFQRVGRTFTRVSFELVSVFQRVGRTFTRVDRLVRVQGYTEEQTQFWKPIRRVLETRRRWKARRLVPEAPLRLQRTIDEQRVLIHEQRPCHALQRREILLHVFVSRKVDPYKRRLTFKSPRIRPDPGPGDDGGRHSQFVRGGERCTAHPVDLWLLFGHAGRSARQFAEKEHHEH